MRSRLFGVMLAFTLLVFALLMFIMVFFFDDIYKAVKFNNLNRAMNTLTESIGEVSHRNELARLVDEYAVKYDTCVSLWDGNFKSNGSTCVNGACRLHTYSLIGAAHFYEQAKNNGGEFIQGYGIKQKDDITNEKPPIFDDGNFEITDNVYESIIYARIIRQQGRGEYLLVLNAVITPLNSVKTMLTVIFAIVGVTMLIFAVILSVALSSYMLEPIYGMSMEAKRLAKGNYNVHFDENSYSEISSLAKTLNYAAQELKSVEEIRRELMANVSHDLRTPLTLISGYAEMMRDFPNDDHGDNLQVIIDEAGRMIMLVNDMADVTKYDAGVQKLAATEYDLTTSVKDTVHRISALHKGEYDIEFKQDCDVTVYGDELKLSQVLHNLINNAITHTGADKRVTVAQTVEEKKKKKYVEISVTDSGDGIPRDKVDTIWSRYYKIDKTYKRAHNGSGLGLSIVRSILELHGAEYGVVPKEEMPEGRGCKFWFRMQIVRKK